MYRAITSFISLLLLSLMNVACHHELVPTSAIQADSLVDIKLPDFTAIVTNSVTPPTKLDQILFLNTVQYDANFSTYTDSIRTKLFYDSMGRVIGNLYLYNLHLAPNETQREQEIKRAQSATVYEYKNDRLFRTFGRVANYETATAAFYQVNEFVYESTPYPTARLEYYADLTGKAKLQRRYNLIYDTSGNLLEEVEANKSLSYERYQYQNGNLNYSESIAPNGALPDSHQEYVYDTKLNPVKGLLLYSGNAPAYVNLSNNNVTRVTTVQRNAAPSLSSVRLNDYDAQDRLIRQTALFDSGSTSKASQVWYYQYGK